MAKDIKDTIAKLLRLSQSDNENEAMSALLKAQELMAKYKVEEYECEGLGIKKRNLKKIVTDITFSVMVNPYTIDLGKVIADNFLCECLMNHKSYARTKKVMFVGLEEDVELCTLTMEFAYKAVMIRVNDIKKDLKKKGKDHYTISCACNSYMRGWVEGLERKLQEQREKEIQDNPSYALVLVKPVEVQDFMKDIGVANFNPNTTVYAKMLKQGEEDGYNFDLTSQIDTNNNKLSCKN